MLEQVILNIIGYALMFCCAVLAIGFFIQIITGDDR